MNRTTLIRVYKYLKALRAFYVSGAKLMPWPEIEKRFEICKPCEHFNGIVCRKCGCCVNTVQTHFNKLAFPTERCPDEPPRWAEYADVDNRSNS